MREDFISDNGLRCTILDDTELHHWCGYVALPPSHRLYGKEIHSIELDELEVHGGVTFAQESPLLGEGLWWLGFDCAHLGDRVPGVKGDTGTFKDADFAYKETMRLAAQLG